MKRWLDIVEGLKVFGEHQQKDDRQYGVDIKTVYAT